MSRFICSQCGFAFNEEIEHTAWSDLPDEWKCLVCETPKSQFSPAESNDSPLPESSTSAPVASSAEHACLAEWRRPYDEFETSMADIHAMAETGQSIIEPMRTRVPTFSWDDILIKGAQLARLPLNDDVPVTTTTIIGPGAACPLVIETPVIISHMSFGALSREAKIALAKGSAAVKTAMCSGEGGILPESLASAYTYIFEYVPNKYSVTDEYLAGVDAVEIKIGQSAKPGMGGHLPGVKVSSEIAAIRGREQDRDIISPSHFDDILCPDDLKRTVDWLRTKTSGKPVGIKLAAGNIEDDLEVALFAGPDFITIDGRAGATGAAPKFIKNAASVPTIFALCRARKFLDEHGADSVSLIITGGMRVSSDFIKALALGADAVAIASAAMMAIGCQQYRVCGSGKCPVGITSQDPVLRARFDIDSSARRLENYLRVSTTELQEFARLTGHNSVHALSLSDVCTANSEISGYTAIEHV